MSQKILGLDLGTGSLGVALRNPDLGDELQEQLEYFSVDVFKSGVGIEKSGEYSLAAERTKHRQSRRLKETRRRRLWATLQLLIDNGMCPMAQESLNQWKTYDKSRGLSRKYPVDDIAFDRWIKLDFDGDGVCDYASPCQLRAELVTEQFDFTLDINKMKLGRALYHIAQRRGFRSSKGETIADQEKNENNSEAEIDISSEMKASETKKSKDLVALMEEHGFITIGQAFAYLENEGVRVHASIYTPVRSQYMEEIEAIFNFQEGLSADTELYRRLLSTKKGYGTIFYQKPLKSQRGNVAKCTLEPNKPRCPIAHPEFEKFRALTLINNIKYRKSTDEQYMQLPDDIRERLYKELFVGRVKVAFDFKEIRERLEKWLGLSFTPVDKVKLINYNDVQSVSGCPVTARLVKLLGEDWEDWKFVSDKERMPHNGKGEKHRVVYTAIDLWNVCYNTTDPEEIFEFATLRLKWDALQAKLLTRLWSDIKQGYAMLSLKAIKKINFMLEKGFIYSDAVFMAKVPDLKGVDIDEFFSDFRNIKEQHNHQLFVNNITNKLIANYKSLPYKEKFAFRDYAYILQDSDHADIIKAIISNVGENTWALMDESEQLPIIGEVTEAYQAFFHDEERDYVKTPLLFDSIKQLLREKYGLDDEKVSKSLYHPSQIDIYGSSDYEDDTKRLGSPKVGGIKNPIALRTLHVLRRKINAMLDKGLISPSETRVVIENTKNLNDANMRWAIEAFQRRREAENKAIREVLENFSKNVTEEDVNIGRYLIEQPAVENLSNNYILSDNLTDEGNALKIKLDSKKLVEKYRLWLEQGCVCMYTGKVISLSNLFNAGTFDIEHTIPRSVLFDNSDKNRTICDAHYNRFVKKNLLPTQLPNYSEDKGGYTAIKPRLEKWEERIVKLKKNVEFWKKQSKFAGDKDRKDYCIRQRHLWQMYLDYWREKLYRFTTKEVKDGFRNSQLVDTSIISSHAVLYMKSVFNNVEVQRGDVTAKYRKMLGIQGLDERKDRSKHSHHAIDAAVLTTIPVAAKRERMLKLFYQIDEMKKVGHNYSAEETQLMHEIEDCNLGKNVAGIVNFIESSILINHIAKDQTLTPASKRMRVRGKEVKVFKNGEWVTKWMKGDCIRGRLHQDTYYGIINYPSEDGTDLERKPLVSNGKFVYPDENGNYFVVTKVDIKSFESIDQLDIVVDSSLRKMLRDIIVSRVKKIGKKITDKSAQKEAFKDDIWLLDKNGREIKVDKNGGKICPVRHVRCKVKAGRGFMTFEKTVKIKRHQDVSRKKMVNITNRNHKNFICAQNDTNSLYLLYEGKKNGKLVRTSRIVNLFELSEMKRRFGEDNLRKELLNNPEFNTFINNDIRYHLVHVINTGTRVLAWGNSKEELIQKIQNKDKYYLSEHLYTVLKFNTTGADLLYLTHHLNAKEKKDLEDLKLTVSKINCLFEHDDFEIDALGNITLLHD